MQFLWAVRYGRSWPAVGWEIGAYYLFNTNHMSRLFKPTPWNRLARVSSNPNPKLRLEPDFVKVKARQLSEIHPSLKRKKHRGRHLGDSISIFCIYTHMYSNICTDTHITCGQAWRVMNCRRRLETLSHPWSLNTQPELTGESTRAATWRERAWDCH